MRQKEGESQQVGNRGGRGTPGRRTVGHGSRCYGGQAMGEGRDEEVQAQRHKRQQDRAGTCSGVGWGGK